MAVADFSDWLNEFNFKRPEVVWYVKRLSANDTQANYSHQAGPYIKRDLLLSLFPSLNQPDEENPDVHFDLYIDSHADHRNVRAVWYNNKLRGGTRNEARLTGFGGQSSALLDSYNREVLTIFVFLRGTTGVAIETYIWVCRTKAHEDMVEKMIGPVKLGYPRILE